MKNWRKSLGAKIKGRTMTTLHEDDRIRNVLLRMRGTIEKSREGVSIQIAQNEQPKLRVLLVDDEMKGRQLGRVLQGEGGMIVHRVRRERDESETTMTEVEDGDKALKVQSPGKRHRRNGLEGDMTARQVQPGRDQGERRVLDQIATVRKHGEDETIPHVTNLKDAENGKAPLPGTTKGKKRKNQSCRGKTQFA
jgi:hypothetical protein